MSKKIGILTSGGDCPGLNAAIRAAALRCHGLGCEPVGIVEGTVGLLDRPMRVRRLGPDDFAGGDLRAAGTILGTTNRGNPFRFPMPDGSFRDRSQEIIDGVKELGLDGVIGIGGDGSLAILRKLAQQGGFGLVGIPKTIDNDIGSTETSIGFSTVVEVATEALDRLQPTAASHARLMVLEVMGRDAGHIALSAGIAGGADIILIPEIPYTYDRIAAHIRQIREQGRNFALVVVSEAVKTQSGKSMTVTYTGGETRLGGIGHYIGERLASLTGAETRVTVLGHVQRGAAPDAQDRILATALGVRAAELAVEGAFDRMVAWSNREVIDVPIEQAIATYRAVATDGALVRTARALGICLGD